MRWVALGFTFNKRGTRDGQMGFAHIVNVITSWPLVSVCDAKLQVDEMAGQGGDAVEGRAPIEVTDGVDGRERKGRKRGTSASVARCFASHP